MRILIISLEYKKYYLLIMSTEDKSKPVEDPTKDYERKYKEMSNLFKDLEKKGLTVKECGFESSRKEFIKGKDFDDILKKNLDSVCEGVNKIMDTSISPTSKDAIQNIYSAFYNMNMIRKAIREVGDKKKNIRRLLPYEMLAKVYGCNCGRDHDTSEQDHKKNYNPDEIRQFNPSFYYVLNINRSMSMIYFYLFLIIFGVLVYALLPIWPYRMKVIVWWVSYILILVILGIYTVRLVVYLFFYIFGYDIWLLPDIQDNKLGFFESFYRVITVEKRNESWITILVRILIAVTTGYIAFSVYRNPGLIDDAKKIIYEALRDFYDFGEDKIVNSFNTTAVSLKYKTKSYKEIDDLI